MLRSSVIGNVRVKLQIRSGSSDTIEDSDIGLAVDNAVRRFSKDRPRPRVKEYLGNGQDLYALPTDWDAYSSIDKIVFDADDEAYDSNSYEVVSEVDTTQRAVSNISSGATSITFSTVTDAGYFKQGDIFSIINSGAVAANNYAGGNGNASTGALALKTAAAATYNSTPKIAKIPHLKFLERSPAATEFFQLHYHTVHTLADDSDSSISIKDQDALEHLAASLTATSIAAKYANTQAAIPDVDAIDYGSKASEWRSHAEAEMKLYSDHMGLGEDHQVEAGGAFVDIDALSQTGRDFFWKSKRYR